MTDRPRPRRRRAQVLAEDGGKRERVRDEPVYRVDGYRSGTFRLQLYTAAGLRPVVVATQDAPTEGCSLVNGAEYYASDVWRTCFPELDEPPLWVQNMHAHRTTMLALVAFDIGPDHTLTTPAWDRITPSYLRELLGQDVDLDRGDRPVPAPQPVLRVRFVLTPVADLPPGRPFRTTECMPPLPTGRRLRLPARLRPLPPLPWDCCWYHGGDWHAANATAIRLTQTTAACADPDDLPFELAEAAAAEGITGWQLQAVESLFTDPIVLAHEDGKTWYVNGQHRGRAMRDAGVDRTITAVAEVVDPEATQSGTD